MKSVDLKIKKLNDKAVLPSYAMDGDFCMDLTAIDVEYKADIDSFVYYTGLAFEIPKGYGVLIFARSSNRKTEAYLPNAVGIIDSGYRGEVLVTFKNRTSTDLNIAINNPQLTGLINPPYKIGDRIAQLVMLPYPIINIVETDELSDSQRGTGGHGSTGN